MSEQAVWVLYDHEEGLVLGVYKFSGDARAASGRQLGDWKWVPGLSVYECGPLWIHREAIQ